MRKLRLYVGCALKCATKKFVERVLALKDELRAQFEILDFHGLRERADKQNIYAFDMQQTGRCDAMLAICDEPSFGLGAEVKGVLSRGCRVIAVAHHDSVVSGFITDMPEIEPLFSFHRYSSMEEIPEILARELL